MYREYAKPNGFERGSEKNDSPSPIKVVCTYTVALFRVRRARQAFDSIAVMRARGKKERELNLAASEPISEMLALLSICTSLYGRKIARNYLSSRSYTS